MRVANGEGEGGGGEIDLLQIARVLYARRWWVIVPTLAALVGSFVFVNVVKPRYTAESRLLLENQENFLPRVDKGERLNEAAPDAEAVQSQIQLLTSRDLARQVIKTLKLQGDEEFDPLAKGIGLTTRAAIALGLVRDPAKTDPEDRILETFAERLNVLSPQKTRVLAIEFTSRDPDLAARGANAVAETYLEFQQQAKRDNAREAAKTLGALVADLRRRVLEAEGRAEEFRAHSGLLLGTNNTTINAQHLTDLNTQLSLSRSAQADAQAKAKLLKEMLRANRIGDIPDVANNEVMRKLQEQRVTLRAQLALESRTLLPGHPRIKELEAQLADLDRQGRAAAERVARTLENDARIAGARVDNLVQALDAQKRVVGASDADEVKLRELERQAHVLKEQFETAAAKYQEALAREVAEATPADARIVQRALAPQVASFPKKLPIVGFATLAALALSVGVIVSSELLSGRARVSLPQPAELREAASSSAARSSAATTMQPAALQEAAPPARSKAVEVIDTQPRERVVDAEASRQLQPAPREDKVTGQREIVSTIDAARLGSSCVKVLISRGDASGLSLATVLALARALARRGGAILVALDGSDCESVASKRNAGRAGLAELLTGEAEFGDVIHRDADSRLHLICAGVSEEEARYDLPTVLEALAQTYDFVVFCAQAGNLALSLAPLFDKILLRAADPQAPLLAERLAASCEDVALVEDAADDLVAA
jgi:polysaccharide biosynthesis transport protein